MTPLSLNFKVSFDSLDDPEAISLDSGTESDRFVMQISKSLVLNGQEGESLVLDS